MFCGPCAEPVFGSGTTYTAHELCAKARTTPDPHGVGFSRYQKHLCKEGGEQCVVFDDILEVLKWRLVEGAPVNQLCGTGSFELEAGVWRFKVKAGGTINFYNECCVFERKPGSRLINVKNCTVQ